MDRENIKLTFKEPELEGDFISDIREGWFELKGQEYKQIDHIVEYTDLEKGYETIRHIFQRKSDNKLFAIEVSWSNAHDEIDSAYLTEVFPKEKTIIVYE